MKARELNDGDYFQSPAGYPVTNRMIGRKMDDELHYFDVDSIKKNHTISDTVKEWGEMEVELIDFQTFLFLLAEQCTQQNQPIEEINKENTIPKETLEKGQFFIDPNDDAIGRRFDTTVVYWTPTSAASRDTFPYMSAKNVVPITLHQAVLFQLNKMLK